MGSYGSQFRACRLSRALLGVIAALVLPLGGAAIAQAQTPNAVWQVLMKSSPCSGSLADFFTVADSNPTGLGGSVFYLPARGPGNVFPRTEAGFAAAHAQADAKRILAFLARGESTGQEKYDNYCCREHTVWRKSLPGGGSTLVTVRGMGTPGEGFTHEAGPMCCEHAAIRAGTTAGCGTLKLSNGSSVALTANGVFPVGAGPITIGPITVNTNGTVGSLAPQPPVLGGGPPVLGVPPSPPPAVGGGPRVSGVSPTSPPPPPVLGGGPPVLGTRPQQPPPVVAPPPAVTSVPQPVQPPRPQVPAEAYYVFALDHGIGLVVATQETVRTRPYCSWTGGGTSPCPAPANVLATVGGPYASVDEARADMRGRLDCESGHWGAFVRHSGDGKFWLQNNLSAADCRSVKRH